ncbi:MAG: DUF4198 domain-containing protein [Zavarzinella sp.]|nr:DUF4198 domain-containing protein [Zavarzinella sp.]
MRLLAAIALVAFASAARAHFPFLVSDGPNKGKAVFSDNLKPDAQVPVDRLANTKLVVVTDGKAADLAWALDKTANCYTFEVPGTGSRIVVGTTDYGVLQRGDSKPFLLHYYPKAIFGDLPAPERATAGDRVPLELVPIADGGKLRFKALSGSKPLPKAEVNVLVPGEEKSKIVATDESGLTPAFEKPGQYGAHVRLTEEKAGEQGGKKYQEVRHYATLVVTFGK